MRDDEIATLLQAADADPHFNPEGRLLLKLVCTGSKRRPHRPQLVFGWDGPPANALLPGATLDLTCPHCDLAPRVSGGQLTALLTIAAASPDGALDISRVG